MTGPTAPPPAGPATWTPPPPPAPAPRKGGVSKTVIAIIAVVVIVLLILALFLTGIIPGLKSSSSSSGAAQYTVTFTESGLPSGTSWSVTLAGSTQSSTTTTVTFSEKNGTYAYSIGAVTGYAPSPLSGSVTVAGAAAAETITFAVGYTVTFTESGLPSGTMWSVTLNGATLSSTTTSIVFTEANGKYTYTVGSVTGYTASPASGSVTVASAAQSVTITFTTSVPGEYPVTFTESGLPGGTSWSVTLAGSMQTSTTSTITFNEKNGTSAYTVGSVTGYTASPSSGNVTVIGAAVGVTVTFTKTTNFGGPQYAVTFEQTGLPSTDIWGAYSYANSSSLLGFGAYNTGPTIEYSAPDGSYFWAALAFVTGPNGTNYQIAPGNGTYTVSGHSVTIMISFVETFYVNFTTTSFPSSFQQWNVTINGSESSYDGNGNVSFELPNGTYPFAAASFGYTASPSSGSITVHNGPASKTITFTKGTTYKVTFTETGLASGEWYATLYFPGGEIDGGNASGMPITFEVPAGTYPFSIPSLFGEYYTASPASGNITVTSGPVSQAIVFTAIPTYAVTATESGLAVSTVWYFYLNATEGSATAPATISVDVPAGFNLYSAYATGYTPVFGNVTVTTGVNALTIKFTAIPPPPTSYNVEFNASGLPTFADYEIYVYPQGTTACPTTCYNYSYQGSPLNFSLPNGHYTWIAETETVNYTASPMAGYLTVNGAPPAIITVNYVNSSADYVVIFLEEQYLFTGTGGLPNGTSWSVTLGGTTESTDAMLLSFLMPNGTTNAYTVTPPAGYAAVPNSGNVTGYYSPNQGEFDLYPPFGPVVILAFEPTGPQHGALVASAGSGLTDGRSGSILAVTRES